MKSNSQSYSINGMFTISSATSALEVTLPGTLSLDVEEIVLHVWSNEEMNPGALEIIKNKLYGTEKVIGILENQKMASLMDCALIETSLSWHLGASESVHLKLRPRYVIIGQREYTPSEQSISHTEFVIDHSGVFLDHSSFGIIPGIPLDQISSLLSIKSFSHIPFERSCPVLTYWTGEKGIFSAYTSMGRISAFSVPSFIENMEGISVNKKVVIEVEFHVLQSVRGLDTELCKLLRFFDTVIGRPQKIVELKIVECDTPNRDSDLHLSMHPRKSGNSEMREASIRDVLINPSDGQEGFSHLLSEWLLKEDIWGLARSRFSAMWSKTGNYDEDRLVGAANMFDLLPDDAVPSDTELEECLESSLRKIMEDFKKLPPSQNKDKILSGLRRLNRPTLKEKIRFRSQVISGHIRDSISGIDRVTDAAVDLRNMYVHGSTSSSAKEMKLKRSIRFLTDTLEFVFGASDLIESGWNIESWSGRKERTSHPFSGYLCSYSERLAKFDEG